MSDTTDSRNHRIPLVVYQTWKTRNINSSIINGIMTRNKAMNLECRFILHDDREREIFIKENFDSDVYKAYLHLNPKFGAARADFWRYCILYKKGGIYIDIKTELRVPLIRIIRPGDECLLDKPRVEYEMYRIENNKPTYEQWMLFFAKDHPYLETMIEMMTRNILDEYIPDVRSLNSVSSYSKLVTLHLTGPDAFTYAINKSIAESGMKHRTVDYERISYITDPKGHVQLYEQSDIIHYSKVNGGIYDQQQID